MLKWLSRIFKPEEYKIDDYFEIIELSDKVGARILRGKFKGTIFSIGEMKFFDGSMSFEPLIIHYGPRHKQTDNEQFYIVAQNVFYSWYIHCEQNYWEVRHKVLSDDETGMDYTEEPDIKRAI